MSDKPSFFAELKQRLGLGDHAQALNWLEQRCRDRDGFNMGVIRVDQFLDPLHGDPRFEALAEKIVPARVFRQRRDRSQMNKRHSFAKRKRGKGYGA